jgi:hypothetical protein
MGRDLDEEVDADCVGGRDIERERFRALKRDMRNRSRPNAIIGERKLSWIEFSSVMGFATKKIANQAAKLVERIREG